MRQVEEREGQIVMHGDDDGDDDWEERGEWRMDVSSRRQASGFFVKPPAQIQFETTIGAAISGLDSRFKCGHCRNAWLCRLEEKREASG